jgi:hypothetical protein
MKGWTPQAIDRANSLQKPPSMPSAPTSKGKTHPKEETPGKSKEKEPAEKHVQLPPAPADCGPWLIAHWTAQRATTYEPRARVVLTGPADEFEQLLAHLQAFTPCPPTKPTL